MRPSLIALLVVAVLLELAAAGPRAASAAPNRRARRLINLDVVGADLRDVVRLLAEVGQVNLLLGDEVSGRVTVRLRAVPWRRALESLLRARGLEAVWQGNILRVAGREALAREREGRLSARDRCLRDAPLQSWLVRPSYASAASIAAALHPALSPRGSVSIDDRTNTVIVRDVRCAPAPL